MEVSRKKLVALLFGLVILCFFLPFVVVSCSGQEIAKVSGFKLAFGTDIQGQRAVNGFALIVLLIAVAGVALYFWQNINEIFVSAVLSTLGFICMIALKVSTNSKVSKNQLGALKASFKSGYYLSLLFLIGIAGINLYTIYKNGYYRLLIKDKEE